MQSIPNQISAADLRILLWDIDGTLVMTGRRGAFLDYTRPAVERVFGRTGRLSELKVSGMTDWQIVAEALIEEGVTHDQIGLRLTDLSENYVRELARITTTQPLYFALPGTHETLTAVTQRPRYRNALLTGNVEAAAYFKLQLVGLSGFFQLPGAFGEDSIDRRELPAKAAHRISQHLATALEPHQFVIIGDTPNDIACAKHFGARSVAVASGRTYSAAELRTQNPDVLLPSLTDPDLVISALDNL
jgi:phosphoglycolate phosphatase-like HAD superfamily hydrolase